LADRYLNRVWSASADGSTDEVSEYLEKAKDQFNESLDLVHRLTGDPPLT
jgi:spore coat polysaccharide biosynthesis protein SpsF (cytidylyltransferase family)